MKVAMLGAGNVATHLSKALINSGFPVFQVWSRQNENAAALALEIGANSISSISEIKEDIDLVVLAVADDAIESVAALIPVKEGRIVVHTSGSTDIAILKEHPNVGVLYPLQTFSKDVELDFMQVPLFVEASNTATQQTLITVAQKLSNRVELISGSERLQLHVSAVFACNFTNYFYGIAQNLMEEASLDFDLIRPLLVETTNKILHNLPDEVQTGPARRNDQSTITKHVSILSAHPDLKEIYELLSKNIIKKYNTPEF